MKQEKKDKKKKNKFTDSESAINKKLNSKSDFKLYELILFAFLIAIASCILTFVLSYQLNWNNNSNTNNVLKKDDLKEIREVYNVINDSYFEKVDKNKLINGAIDGMLSSLDDPHTNYMDKETTENFDLMMDGEYKGIGVEIAQTKDNEIVVFGVFKNSPAYNAGIKPLDVIISVDNKKTEGLSTTEVVKLIKGNSKKEVLIKVKREDKELEFNVKKDNVIIESVESRIIEKDKKKIGYVIVNNFASNTYEQFRYNIEELEKSNINGLIIDVRGNSGGYLHVVSNMIDMFLPKDKVMYKIADRKKTVEYKAQTVESRNYPIAVLINEASASASEILAISLKESYNAFIVGKNSYGKGTVQITKDLNSGGMIKYTVNKWLSPKGNWINKKGVTPTHEVELPEDFYKNPSDDGDTQLQKAVELILNSK